MEEIKFCSFCGSNEIKFMECVVTSKEGRHTEVYGCPKCRNILMRELTEKQQTEEWILTISKGILEKFSCYLMAKKHLEDSGSFPMFHEIDKDHYLMGNMHLCPISKLEYCK